MNQSLHLLIVDRHAGKILATWRCARWLLPILTMPELVRPGPPVVGWAASVGLRAQMLGQWLGCLAPNGDSIDWLAVAQAVPSSSSVGAAGLCWRPIHELQSSSGLLDYQDWALTEASSRGALLSVPGPFGTLSWLDAATTWAEGVLGARMESTMTSYRTTPYEVALGLETRHGRVFFKGLSVDRASEATITSALSQTVPDSFARTLALRPHPDGSVWWLVEECAGTELAADLTAERAARVAMACGRLQAEATARLADVVRHLPRVDMQELDRWGATLLLESGIGDDHEQHRQVIARACAAVDSANITESVIPADLDPGNVFLHGDEVRFIDLDEVHRGPAPLALPMFVRRFVGATADGSAAIEARSTIYRAYETSCPSLLPMRALWPAFEIASALFEAHLSWTRVRKKIRRGEVRGVDDAVRAAIVRRLLRATESDVGII